MSLLNMFVSIPITSELIEILVVAAKNGYNILDSYPEESNKLFIDQMFKLKKYDEICILVQGIKDKEDRHLSFIEYVQNKFMQDNYQVDRAISIEVGYERSKRIFNNLLNGPDSDNNQLLDFIVGDKYGKDIIKYMSKETFDKLILRVFKTDADRKNKFFDLLFSEEIKNVTDFRT